MKLLKQVMAGLAILALAIVLVDCNKNLQEVLEEQVTKSATEQANAVATSAGAGPPPEIAANQETNRVLSSQEPSKPIASDSSFVVYAQEDEVSEKEAVKTKSAVKKNKIKKCKVITIRIPDDLDAQTDFVEKVIAEEAAHEKGAEKEEEPKDERAVGKEETKLTVDNPENTQSEVEQQKSEVEEKATKQHENKNKTSNKKLKGETKKRDKRETKRSGSGKNGKTKRSAEKSKKYENKKKSKK